MNKLDLEMYDKTKFVRMGEEIKLGSSHFNIVKLMLEGEKLWVFDTESIPDILDIRKQWNIVMEKRINNDANQVDMGFLVRTRDNVFVCQVSSTFDCPRPNVFEETRTRTMEVLSKLYPDDKFVRRNQ